MAIIGTGPVVNTLGSRLVELAGYPISNGGRAGGGAYANEYLNVLDALAYIGNRKVDDYGDFRLQDIRSWDRETWGAFWDILRKFGRLETQMTLSTKHYADALVLPAESARVDAMMETLSDMAVYCVRMIQILRRLEEKGMVPPCSVSQS